MALGVLLGLGFWQLDRLAWKTDLIAAMEARGDRPPVTLPAEIDDPAAWEHRRVRVSGAFLPSDLLVLNRTHEGAVGRHVITPLRRSDAEDEVVLVNRGWIPAELETPPPPPEGEVEVVGVARLPETPGLFTPDNDSDEGAWYWRDGAAMAEALGVEAAPLFIFAAGPEDSLPRPADAGVEIQNNHFGYALTWFSLAAVLLIIFVLSQRRRNP